MSAAVTSINLRLQMCGESTSPLNILTHALKSHFAKVRNFF